MRKLSVPFLVLLLLAFMSMNYAQEYKRKVVDVPQVKGKIIIDGKMTESDWQNAAHADILTSSGSEGFFNKYFPYGDALTEPDYKEIYGRMLWSKDTLYLFYHVQQVKNDTLGLYFGDDPKNPQQWAGDQMFVGLSNRLAIETLPGSYNGSPYTAPDGPYHFFIYGNKVTLNGNHAIERKDIPAEWLSPTDTASSKIFYADSICHYAVQIDTNTATWDVEMAIFHPDVAFQSVIGFDLGGNQGARKAQNTDGDHTYSYYAWQPSTPNDPYKDPVGIGDPGSALLVTSKYWGLLNFVTSLSGVERDKNGGVVPSEFTLTQNYPNPFNPSTTIRFTVPQLSNVTLKVYNIVGQEVATLVNNQQMSAGKYQVDWNASRLASGVYLYSLEAGSVHITKKMMLLK